MGIVLEEKTQTAQTIRRCCQIVIRAPYGETPTITQEYEEVIAIDGEKIGSKQVEVITHSLADLFGVTYTINGKELTGNDIAQFIFKFNDTPKSDQQQ